jgi:hypothetical protein
MQGLLFCVVILNYDHDMFFMWSTIFLQQVLQ